MRNQIVTAAKRMQYCVGFSAGMKRDAETLSKRAERFAGLDNPVVASSSPAPAYAASPVERATPELDEGAMDTGRFLIIFADAGCLPFDGT